MNQQQKAALEAMTNWLSHEQELGHKPHKIEPAGDFMLHDMKYYLFKYKKKMFGGWLLGVCGGYESPSDTEHCGHVFSRTQPYDPATAVKEATDMIEMIRQYWMEKAAEIEAGAGGGGVSEDAEQEDDKKGGLFNGFVLLNSAEFRPEQLKAQLLQDWNIDCASEEDGEDNDVVPGVEDREQDGPLPLVFEADGCMLAISFIPAPVPDNEAVVNAGSNYLWPQAEEVAETHVAQLIIAVFPRESSMLDAASTYVKLASSCLKLPSAIGLYSSGTVFQPSFFQDVTNIMKEDGAFPLLNLIYFGLVRTEQGVGGYTIGLNAFGKDEIEIIDSPMQPSELREFLIDICSYIVEYDVTLRDGETIGFSEEQKLQITRSKGVYIKEDSLKIKL